jgi:hypothetical protein
MPLEEFASKCHRLDLALSVPVFPAESDCVVISIFYDTGSGLGVIIPSEVLNISDILSGTYVFLMKRCIEI